MSSMEIPYNIGYKLGELIQLAETCNKFAKNSTQQRPTMNVIQVFESLRYIILELEILAITIHCM